MIILLAISVHTAFGQRVLSLDEGKITEGISPTVPSRDVDVTTESACLEKSKSFGVIANASENLSPVFAINRINQSQSGIVRTT